LAGLLHIGSLITWTIFDGQRVLAAHKAMWTSKDLCNAGSSHKPLHSTKHGRCDGVIEVSDEQLGSDLPVLKSLPGINNDL
jgi:hypothetical protein